MVILEKNSKLFFNLIKPSHTSASISNGISFCFSKLLPFTPKTMTFARFLVISNR